MRRAPEGSVTGHIRPSTGASVASIRQHIVEVSLQLDGDRDRRKSSINAGHADQRRA